MSRTSNVPRIVWPLLLAIVVLAWWLLSGERNEGPVALFDLAPVEVVRIDLQTDIRQQSLILGEQGWRLEGDIRDHLDQNACEVLLTDFCGLERSPAAVVETMDEAASRLYGFEREPGVTLSLTDRTGRNAAVVVGAVNEVTGAVYVRKADGEAVHLAPGLLRERIDAVPDGLRALELWPDYVAGNADTVRLEAPDGSVLDFMRDDRNYWWVRGEGLADYEGPAVAYHGLAEDRSRREDGDLWRLANGSAQRSLLSVLDNVRVRDFEPWSRASIAEPLPGPRGGLSVFARREGGRSLVFGERLSQKRIRVWRDGCPASMIIQEAPAAYLDSLFTDPLHPYLLALTPMRADSLTMSLSGFTALRAAPRTDGRWMPGDGVVEDDQWLDQLGDTVMNLGRVRLGEVLAPSLDTTEIFQDDYRLQVDVYGRGPDGRMRESWVLGAGVRGESVVAWRPDDGFRCRIDRQILITARGLITGRSSHAR